MNYIGSKFSVALNSGTDALHLALRALDIGAGDEVITVACGFPTTVNPIIQYGAVPVFVDVNGPKPPNKGGTDQFMLKMTNVGLVYTGQGAVSTKQATSTSNTCTSGTDDYALAWACAAKIQLDGWNVKY